MGKRWTYRLRHVFNDHAKFYYNVNGYMLETTDTTTSRDGAKFYAICAFPKFQQIVAETDPATPESKIRGMFQQALAFLQKTQLEEHEKKWQSFVDPETKRHFFYSASTNESYWSRPPLEKFEVGEITLQAFIHVAQKHRLGQPPHSWDPTS